MLNVWFVHMRLDLGDGAWIYLPPGDPELYEEAEPEEELVEEE